MIGEVIRSVSARRYQVKDLSTSVVYVVNGSAEWRPGDRVVVADNYIVGKSASVVRSEVVRV